VDYAGVNFLPQSVYLNVPRDVSLTVETIREGLHPDAEPWIIIDTRSRCLLGNENSTEDMSAFVRGCDTIIRVERDESRVTLTCTKQKDGPDFAPFAFEALQVANSLVLNEVELSGGKLEGNRLKALRALHENSTADGMRYTPWHSASGIKAGSSFNEARDWLKSKAYVSHEEGKWKLTEAGKLSLNALRSTHSTGTPVA
jgi:hypothetical protein